MSGKDISEKVLLAYNDVFADIVNGLLFAGKQIIAADDLAEHTIPGRRILRTWKVSSDCSVS